jgi:hypothetical protein
MKNKIDQDNRALARQLSRARYATLNSRAISASARSLVDEVYDRIAKWERKSNKRKNKRQATSKRFRDSVAAFVADLVRARGDRVAKGWVYRSMHAKNFSRQQVSYRNFIRLVDALSSIGHLQHKPGFQGKVDFGSGSVVHRAKAARFRATAPFVTLAKRLGVDPAYTIDHFTEELPEHPLRLHAASTRSQNTGAKIRGRNMRFDYTPRVLAIEEEVKSLNVFLRQFEFGGALHQYYVRIFNEGDDPRFDWNLGGRLYSPGKTSYQQMLRAQRSTLSISGEPVCEIDISASYLTIFLSRHGEQIELGKADPYAKDELVSEDRDAVKQWFVATFGSGDFVKKWSKMAVDEFRERTKKDLRKFSPESIRKAAIKAYPLLERWPEDEFTWADLMWLESEAIFRAMLALKERNIPSLAIHDSLMVPLAHRGVTEWQMSVCYEQITGVQPIVRTRVPYEGT